MIRSKFLQMGTTTNVFNLSPRNASTSSLCKRLQGKVAIVTASTDGYVPLHCYCHRFSIVARESANNGYCNRFDNIFIQT